MMRDMPPSVAARLSRACRSHASGRLVYCPMSATARGAWGAGRTPNASAGNSPSYGRRMISPMALLSTIGATHCLSTANKRLPGLGTRRIVQAVDSNTHRP